MTSRWGVLVLGTALGCAHAETTDRASQKGPSSNGQDSSRDDRKQSHEEPPHDQHAAAPAGERAAPKPEIQKPGHPPVATHADQLLAPGAEKKIRDKLAAAHDLPGPDAPLADGLKKFQTAHDMPATGVPDTETVRRLGLDPGEIFRSADDGR